MIYSVCVAVTGFDLQVILWLETFIYWLDCFAVKYVGM